MTTLVKTNKTRYPWLGPEFSNFFGKDDFFNDCDFIETLEIISKYEELSRYPQTEIQSWSSSPISLLKFLDEFVFEMRKKIVHNQYDDVIIKFLNGYVSDHPSLSWEFNKFIKPEQIQKFLTFDNDYFKPS